MKISPIRFFLTAILLTLMVPASSFAIDPFDSPAAPPGFYFINYPTLISADEFKGPNGDTALRNIDLDVLVNVFRLSYYNKTWFENHTAGVTVLAPVGKVDLFGQDDSGLGDITIAPFIHVIDKPQQGTWLLATTFIDAPTGSYDKNATANLGNNVFKIKPSLLFARIRPELHFEGMVQYGVHTENDDTKFKAGNEVVLETYFGRSLNKEWQVGGHLEGVWGQDGEASGLDANDSAVQKHRAGVSLNWSRGRAGVLMKYMKDFNVENLPSTDMIQFRIMWKL